MTNRPSRHGDVLAAVLIIVGTATWFSLCFATSFERSSLAMAITAAVGAFVGGWLARQVRADLQRGELIGAALLATMIVPAVARWKGIAVDHDALVAIAIGAPLAALTAWLATFTRATALEMPMREALAGAALMSAAMGFSVVLFPLVQSAGEHGYDLALGLAGIALGIALAKLVPDSSASDAGIGAAIAWLGPWVLPRMLGLRGSLMNYMPLRFAVVSAITLAATGALGWWLGRRHRPTAAPPSNLPEAKLNQS